MTITEAKKGFHCQIVGLNHHITKATMQRLENLASDKPLKARLEREPDNSYDENAIKLILTDDRIDSRQFGGDEFFVGYVRRQVAAVLAQALDRGSTSTAVLEHVDVEHAQGKAFVKLGSKPKKATPRKARKTPGKRTA